MTGVVAAVWPLLPAQLPIWHAEVLRPGTSRWTQFSVTTLTGSVDPARLAAALAAAVACYPALRTCLLRRQGQVVQAFHDPAGFATRLHDLSALPAGTRDEALARLLSEGGRHRFQTVGGWLFRADIVCCAPGHTLLLLFMHHLATDGMSLPAVLGRVSLAYRGEAGAARPDHLHGAWLDRGVDAAALDAARAAYRRTLAGAVLRHEALYDREAMVPPSEPPHLAGSARTLEPAAARGLLRLAQRTGSTLFLVCLAAFGLALGRLTGAGDLVVGVFVSGRGGASGLVAMAVNTLLVRLRLDADMAPATAIGHAREAWRAVRRLDGVPFQVLRQASGGDPATLPASAQCAMNFLDMRGIGLDLPGVASHTTYPQPALPLNDAVLLAFREHDDRLRLELVNGSGTGRLSAARLDTACGAVAGLLLGWAQGEAGLRPGAPNPEGFREPAR